MGVYILINNNQVIYSRHHEPFLFFKYSKKIRQNWKRTTYWLPTIGPPAPNIKSFP